MHLTKRKSIPNLWRRDEDARRVYELFLVQLLQHGAHLRIVEACRTIRGYAARGPKPTECSFTYWLEIEALCALGEYAAAWQQLRRRERAVFGERLDLFRREWAAQDSFELEFRYAPLLYFCGRYREGCTLLESALLLQQRRESYGLLHRVYNDDPQPGHLARVTLYHFYTRLGRDLTEWTQWQTFVEHLHLELLQLADVDRAALSQDASLLPVLCSALQRVRDERTTSGVTHGISDLIQSPAQVRHRQEATAAKIDTYREQNAEVLDAMHEKLLNLFPELAAYSNLE